MKPKKVDMLPRKRSTVQERKKRKGSIFDWKLEKKEKKKLNVRKVWIICEKEKDNQSPNNENQWYDKKRQANIWKGKNEVIRRAKITW